jgi:hypothetical protein
MASKKQEAQERKDARKLARQAKKVVRKKTRVAKRDARQEKRATKQDARRDARSTRSAAREAARRVEEVAEGGTKAEKKKARKTAKATRKAGRTEARDSKRTARQKAKTTAKRKIGAAKDKKQTTFSEIRAEKKAAIRTTRKGWQNWLHDLKTDARRVDPPRNARQLRAIIQAAVDQGRRLKPVSTGHSHSNATQPSKGHWYVDISGLSGLIDLKGERKHWARHADKGVVRVKAGTRLQNLTSQLLAPRGLAVANMGSFDGQHFSGVVNTDTHGTGLGLGGFGDMVVSADIFVVVPDAQLRPTVELWRVEPRRGQTDPTKASSLRNIDRLVQDDELFHSMVVGFGSFGIAYSYLLQVVPYYWLDEVCDITTVKGVKELWDGASPKRLPSFLTQNRHSWVFVNSVWAQVDNTKADKGDPKRLNEIPVRLIRQNSVQRRSIPKNFKHEIHPIWPPMRRRDDIGETLGKTVGLNLADSGKEGGRRIASTIDSKFIEDTEPPFFHTGNRSAYYRVLRRTRDGRLSKARTAKSRWDNTRVDAPPVPPTLALSIDMSVPAWELPKALDRALKEIKAETIKMAVPIGIRFTAASNHFMAASYGRKSAFLELAGPVERKSKRDRDLARYKRAFTVIGEAIRKAVPEARPHLGKHHGLKHRDLLKHYPKADTWLELQGYLNFSGTWTSPFASSLGSARFRKSATQTRRWLERRLR